MIRLETEVKALSAANRLAALKRIVPPAVVNAAVRECGKDRTRCRRVPAVAVVWFVLGLGLFCRDCHRQVYRWLNRYDRRAGVPGRSTLCEARRRVGVRPLVRLAGRVVRLLADPAAHPAAFHKGMRLMAVDGFVVNLADSPANAAAFGRPGGGRAAGAFPQARVVAPCEAGTHVLWRWLVKPVRTAEQGMADHLIRRHLAPGMLLLLLWDRGFHGRARVAAVAATGAHLLGRAQARRPKLVPTRVLADGSYLADLHPTAAERRRGATAVTVRVVDYALDGRGDGKPHRLVTTLLDAAAHPARDLVGLYHARWEQELAIDEVKTHGMDGRATLRSRTPAGVVQELYALLVGHFVVRAVACEAAAAAGVDDPRRVSFTATLKVLRCRLCDRPSDPAGRRRWWRDVLAEVGDEVLPPRRDRVNPRVVRRKMSKWPKKRPCHFSYPQPTKDFRACIEVTC